MKISELSTKTFKIFQDAKLPTPRIDSEVLLCNFFNITKEQLIFDKNLECNNQQLETFLLLVNKRINREPISHLIGKREFFGNDFVVSKDVLDPRPDSEALVELILKQNNHLDEKKRILELGVGSGCLIISLLLMRKNYQGTGVDISKKALEICAQNARKNQISDRLKLIESDLFSKLNILRKFDLIISNPPYIPSAEIESLEPEVSVHEPRIALDGGIDGLDFYRRIAENAENFLNKNGKIFLEIGFNQEHKITEIFHKNNFRLISTNKDLAGIVRVLEFQNFS